MTNNFSNLPKGSQSLVLLRKFFSYVKGVSIRQNQIQLDKKKLANCLNGIQYTNIFQLIDFQKKGKIQQKNLQQFLIINKHYHYPQSINRFFLKYSNQKSYLDYNDLIESLLPHSDYITVSSTILNLQNKKKSFFQQKSNKEILTAKIISLQIRLLDFDYSSLKSITNLSYERGAQLWRLLDKNHQNAVDFKTIKNLSKQLGINIDQKEWKFFLMHHFHITKHTITRDYFMKMIDCLNQKIRITNNFKIEQFIVVQCKQKLALQENLKHKKIESIILQKLSEIQKQHLNQAHIHSLFKNKIPQKVIYQKSPKNKISLEKKSVELQNTKQTSKRSSISFIKHHSSQNIKNKNETREKRGQSLYSHKSMEKTRENSQKKLLISKIGYRNPEKLIKSSFFR